MGGVCLSRVLLYSWPLLSSAPLLSITSSLFLVASLYPRGVAPYTWLLTLLRPLILWRFVADVEPWWSGPGIFRPCERARVTEGFG
jgi:hypothetical protein